MTSFLIIAILAVAVVLAGWAFARRSANARMNAIRESRRASSRLVGPGTLVDGNRHIPVELALTGDSLIYENADIKGSLDLDMIHGVEYSSELATGQDVTNASVLRLRSNSQSFEFLVPADQVAKWQGMLPAHDDDARADRR